MTSNKQSAEQTDQEKMMEKWQQAVEAEEAKFNQTHIKKEFTFNRSELRQLNQLYTIQVLAQRGLEDLLNHYALPRVQVLPDPEVKILYDLAVGRFVIWTPKEPTISEVKTAEDPPES